MTIARVSFRVTTDNGKLNIEIRNESKGMSIYETVFFLYPALEEVVSFIDNNQNFEIDGNVKDSPLAALNEYANDVIYRFRHLADYERMIEKMMIMNNLITCHVKNAIKKQESLFDIMYHWFETEQREVKVIYVNNVSYHSSCLPTCLSDLIK